jgi:hypothetical protein
MGHRRLACRLLSDALIAAAIESHHARTVYDSYQQPAIAPSSSNAQPDLAIASIRDGLGNHSNLNVV